MMPVSKSLLNKEYEANGIFGAAKAAKNPPVPLDKDITEVTDRETLDLMVAAAQLLTDTEFMKKALTTLEAKMLEVYETNLKDPKLVAGSGVPTKKSLQSQLKSSGRAQNDASRHLLAEALNQFESAKDRNFKTYATLDGHPRILQMTGTLTADSFNKVSQAAQPAKDYVTKTHGVYTHRIQWFCLGQHKDFEVDTGNKYKKFSAGGAWKITFDRMPKHGAIAGTPNEAFDFRVPEVLNEALMKGSLPTPLPLLAAYLTSKDYGNRSWQAVRAAVSAKKLFPDVAALKDWKTWPAKDIDAKLLAALGTEKYAQLKEFLAKNNVLIPGEGGVYQMQ